MEFNIVNSFFLSFCFCFCFQFYRSVMVDHEKSILLFHQISILCQTVVWLYGLGVVVMKWIWLDFGLF